ncbi:MAG: VanZ family protein [Bacteroidales bacterium]|jgi:VanZ family protein|nr:VanZ family protein [Bacteroidales bacterium]
MDFILKNKKIFGIIFWCWAAFILFISIIPSGPEMKTELNGRSVRLDYLFHFIAYLTLAIFYLLWKANKYFNLKPRLLYSFLIGGLILAAGSEAVQSIIPERTFNPYDFYANAAGIIVGVITPKLIFIRKDNQ